MALFLFPGPFTLGKTAFRYRSAVFVYQGGTAVTNERRIVLCQKPIRTATASPSTAFCRSLELGVITMNNDIIGKVSALHDMKIEDDHITAVIQGQETILPDDVKKTIREATTRHADTILNKLRELQVDLRANPVIFIGGGAVLFKDYLENSPMVTKADFILDPKANAIGFGMLADRQIKKLDLNGGYSENA